MGGARDGGEGYGEEGETPTLRERTASREGWAGSGDGGSTFFRLLKNEQKGSQGPHGDPLQSPGGGSSQDLRTL